MRLFIEAVVEALIPPYALPLPVRVAHTLMTIVLVALIVLSIAGERFYAQRPDAAQMWRARVILIMIPTNHATTVSRHHATMNSTEAYRLPSVNQSTSQCPVDNILQV